jgi:hypothetical protein
MSDRAIQGGPNEIEVYLGKTGFVCIKQKNWPDVDAIITVRRDDVQDLIDHLRATYQEAMDYVPPPTES